MRKNYNRWIHKLDFQWDKEFNNQTTTTVCGKTARRTERTNEDNKVTCKRCIEIIKEVVKGGKK